VRESSVIILVTDGLRPDSLDEAISAGDVPELAALRGASGMNVITTVFPSVTGVAYVPMLTGVHPAGAGIPGLRWFDRAHRLPAFIGHSRSYVGVQLRQMDSDLSPDARTAFEHVGGQALGAASMITRGLPRARQLDRGFRHAARVIRAHVTGDVDRWAALEQELGETLVSRIRRERPRFVFAAFTAGDKAAHAAGATAAGVRRSLRLVDHVAGSIRRDAERDGRWNSMHLWVVSDHGHSPVHRHPRPGR
jgi:predicted AlkP superfamily pyrophosphatase or phosphodiesterase